MHVDGSSEGEDVIVQDSPGICKSYSASLPRRMHSALRRISQTSAHLNRRALTTMATDTSTYKFNHSMIRIKDPKVSVPFYEKNFGMKVIEKKEMKEAKFDLCRATLGEIMTRGRLTRQISSPLITRVLRMQGNRGRIERVYSS